MTIAEHITISDLVGREINEVEYIDHIVIKNDTTWFYIINLDDSNYLLDAEQYIFNL